jgi:hypothetical protein
MEGGGGVSIRTSVVVPQPRAGVCWACKLFIRHFETMLPSLSTPIPHSSMCSHSEMSVNFYQTTQHDIPEDCHLELTWGYKQKCISSLDELGQILFWPQAALPYAQPVFHGTPVCHEIFTSHYNYNHNEINNCKNMNKYLYVQMITRELISFGLNDMYKYYNILIYFK